MAFSFISHMWSKWNIRGFVILSLSLQVYLIIFASLRKKTVNKLIVLFTWLAYLMADWVAAFTIGLISHNQGNSFARATEVYGALQPFWASFLLLHLGGPDTITAFSLEDSSLWRRHLLTLICQVGAAIYVFVQIFTSDKSLMIPTILVFIAGVIKNVERTLALKLSSFPKLKETILSQRQFSYNESEEELVTEAIVQGNGAYNEFFEELRELGDVYGSEKAKMSESVVVKHAYYFFHIFKVFLADLTFTRHEREISREYFGRISSLDALRVIAVELHFMYEVLYTKALAIRSKWSYIFRFIAMIDVVVAFILFNRLKKHQFPKLDVEITYLLLWGGIALDVISLFMLIVSDWTIARIMYRSTRSYNMDLILQKLISTTDIIRKARFTTYSVDPNSSIVYASLQTSVIFRKWSESIFRCNLLSERLKLSRRKMPMHDLDSISISRNCNFCSFPFFIARKINSCFRKINSCFRQVGETIAGSCGWMKPKWKRSIIANLKYVSKTPFLIRLWICIFQQIKRKSYNAHDPMEVRRTFEARGDLFIENSLGSGNPLLEYVTTVDYDASIIIWHIATEILYNKNDVWERNDHREVSKILSDYMLYLLFNQPDLMSAVAVPGIAQMRSARIMDEIKEIYNRYGIMNVKQLCITLSEDSLQTLSSESLLHKACHMAKKMELLQEMKWNLISGVWIEMLSFAAIHIKGEAHMQVLSKGGELLTFVWLLMAHFGCFCTPQWGLYYEHMI